MNRPVKKIPMADKDMPRCDFDTDSLLLRLQMTLPAVIGSIDPVVEGVMRLVREMGCAEGKDFEVETSLREALSNAIRHGCGSDPDKSVQFCVACDQDRGMLIIIRDPGAGFDPKQVPSPIVGRNIFSSHGRGVFLINQLMDDVRYHRGGTEIHMHKR